MGKYEEKMHKLKELTNRVGSCSRVIPSNTAMRFAKEVDKEIAKFKETLSELAHAQEEGEYYFRCELGNKAIEFIDMMESKE